MLVHVSPVAQQAKEIEVTKSKDHCEFQLDFYAITSI